MHFWRLLPVLATLGGCVAPTPLVDMTGVDPVVYQRDLDYCQSIASSADKYGPLFAGALIGGTAGLGAGAFAAPATSTFSASEGYGAAAGAAAGTGAAAIAGPPPPRAAPTPEEMRSVADCLRVHGYKVLKPDAG